MKKTLLISTLSLAFISTTVGCDVDQTQQGELPTMDVEVSGDPGELPAYDVDGPEVEVTNEESTIEVPDVDVDMEKKTITTPDVDISLPDDEPGE